ncbi:MAG: hypothetical protein WBW61_08205, partial [Rhodanobacteraceae bacterium]
MSARSSSGSIRQTAVRVEDLARHCRGVAGRGGRLVSLWASERPTGSAAQYVLSLALQDDDGLHVVEALLEAARPEYPDLGTIFPVAERLQRAAFDLCGVR